MFSGRFKSSENYYDLFIIKICCWLKAQESSVYSNKLYCAGVILKSCQEGEPKYVSKILCCYKKVMSAWNAVLQKVILTPN